MVMRSLPARILLLAALLAGPPAVAAVAQAPLQVAKIQIQVLNGRKGKPVRRAKAFTTVLPVQPYATPIASDTGRLGTFSLLVQTGTQVHTTVSKYTPCSFVAKADRKKPPAAYAVDDILSHGVVAENHCSTRTAKATPGELILFVRPLHWWQRLHP